jgi:hypothetical protein
MLPPITRADPSVPAQNLFISKYNSTPLVGPPRSREGTLGLWQEIFCFVRNGYSIEVPINDSIFELLLKIASLLTRTTSKQISNKTIISLHNFSWNMFRGNSSWLRGSYDNITLQRVRTNRFNPRHQLSYLVAKCLFKLYFWKCEKEGLGK